MKNRSQSKPPEICPVCGEEVPPKSLACPECGADHNSGWKEEAELNEVDLPSDDFNYEEFAQREFGNSIKPAEVKLIWWVTALILVVALACFCFWSR